MGYPNQSHIKKFVKGKTIDDICEWADGSIRISFTDGEKLLITPRLSSSKIETIATPFGSDGNVKSSIEIEK